MKINKQTAQWLRRKPKSYVNKLQKEGLLSMDLGECNSNLKKPISFHFDSSKLNHYPHGQEELKKAIARKFAVRPNMISLGNGSDEIIEQIPQLFIDPGDHVVAIVPTFFRFIDASLRKGAQMHFVHTQKEDNFAVTEQTVRMIIELAKKTKAKLIWLCSPNNPTGIPIKQEDIEKIIKNTHALVILDQVFAELQNGSATETISLTKKFDNLIILKSFSKVFGFAGIRVGFAIANPSITQMLQEWRLPFNISSASIVIAEKIIRDEALIPRIKSIVIKERTFLFSKIKLLKNFELIDNSETNIFLLRHKEKDIFHELLKHNILAADLRTAKGLEKMNFVRVTLGTHQQNIELLKALKEIN